MKDAMSVENISPGFLYSLISRGSSLHERLGLLTGSQVGSVTPVCRRRMDRWRAVVAGNDIERFQTRLRESGLAEADFHRLLDDAFAVAPTSMPPWVETLTACLQAS